MIGRRCFRIFRRAHSDFTNIFSTKQIITTEQYPTGAARVYGYPRTIPGGVPSVAGEGAWGICRHSKCCGENAERGDGVADPLPSGPGGLPAGRVPPGLLPKEAGPGTAKRREWP